MAREFSQTSLYSDANLVAYYKLEDLTDTKGGFTLTNNGSATFVAGLFNNCVNLSDASNQYLETSNSLGIDGGAISMSAWINVASAPALNIVNSIFIQGNNTSKTGYWLSYFNNAGTLQLFFARGKYGVGDQTFAYNVTLSTSTWYHVAYTYDGSTVTGYLNGVSIGTVSASGNGSSSSFAGFGIGRDSDTPTGRTWDGKIDDTAIFSRALTASEVKSIYTSRTFQKDTNNSLNVGLVSYYKLGDTYDFYGSNNATNVGTSTFTSGKYNNALTLNGSSQYLSVANGMFPWGTNNWSVSLWFKRSSGTDICMFGSHDGTGAGGLEISYGASSGSGKLGVSKIGAAGTQATYTWTADTNWHHLVATQSSTAGLILYLDGSAVNTQAANTSNVINSNKAIGIGARIIGTTPADVFFPGQIDEVGIWNKALSTTEISDLYNGGNGQTMNPPIEFDAISSGQATSTSLTVSHTTGTGSNRCLLVGFHSNDGDLATGITYNSVAMTQLVKQVDAANRTLYIYGLLNPATGANNIVASVSSNSNLTLIGASYFGVAQSGLPDATTSSTNTSSNVTSASSTLTTVADNAWITSFNYANGSAQDAGTNTRQRTSIASGTRGWYDGGPFTPAGSNTLNFTFSGGTGGGNPILDIVTASIAPFTAAGPANLKSFNGLAKASIKSINGTAIGSIKSLNGLS